VALSVSSTARKTTSAGADRLFLPAGPDLLLSSLVAARRTASRLAQTEFRSVVEGHFERRPNDGGFLNRNLALQKPLTVFPKEGVKRVRGVTRVEDEKRGKKEEKGQKGKCGGEEKREKDVKGS